MTFQRCNNATEHMPHEWYRAHILRRNCPGLIVAFCGRTETHTRHWYGEVFGELCYGVGLAGRCPHGEQMLHECGACEVEQEMDALVAEIEEGGNR